MKRLTSLSLILGSFFSFLGLESFGQADQNDIQLNTITTAVPFLLIAPDARHSALGDAGVATSPDANSTHWNPAKWADIDEDGGIAISYTPWLRNLVNDMGIMYLTGFKRLNERTTLAGSLKYFSLGQITFTNERGEEISQHNPNEFALDVAAGTKLSKKFSGGIAARYIFSNLTNGINDTKTSASSFAVDVSSYFRDDIKLFDLDGEIGVGINISNIGAKMSYSDFTGEKDFIPTNLRLGQATKLNLDEYNSLTLVTDLNKLLVPTPQYETDANGNLVRVPSDESVASGMFNSFSDAPRGTEEELEEISYSIGLEYWYNSLIAFRGGYFYEHPNKGDRQYWTAGFGLRLNVFGLDASYLIANNNNPLANTFRFTLYFSFDAFKAQQQDEEFDD